MAFDVRHRNLFSWPRFLMTISSFIQSCPTSSLRLSLVTALLVVLWTMPIAGFDTVEPATASAVSDIPGPSITGRSPGHLKFPQEPLTVARLRELLLTQ